MKPTALIGSLLALVPALSGLAQTYSASPYYFGTLAGVASVGYVDGTGTAARFMGVSGVAADQLGNIYVTDTGNAVIRKIDAKGVVSTLAGSPGTLGLVDGVGTAARFQSLGALGIDSAGNLYAADYESVRKITPAGAVSTLNNQLSFYGKADYVEGLAVNAAGTVYVSASVDYAAHGNTLFQISPAGVLSLDHRFTGSGMDAITLNPAGALAYFDPDQYAVFQISDQGTALLAGNPGVHGSADGMGTAAGFTYVSGLAAGSDGSIAVADNGDATIRLISPAGLVSTLAGSSDTLGCVDGTGTAAQFGWLGGIARDASGSAWVADSNALRRIAPDGTVSTVAGLSHFQSAGSADGLGGQARFNGPSGITADASGNVYVVEANHTVRKISPQGVVSTLAGSAGLSGHVDGQGTAARFYYPSGVAVDGSGNAYVLDGVLDGDATVRKITPTGIVSTWAGQPGQGYVDGTGTQARFYAPSCIAADSSGNVYVADYGAPIDFSTPNAAAPISHVRHISPAGVVTTVDALTPYMTANTMLTSMALDAAGALYAYDWTNKRILKMTAGGAVSQTGTSFPGLLTVDPAGAVFLSDVNGTSLGRLQADGTVLTIAGSTVGQADGVGSAARFGRIMGLTADTSGNLYVSDEYNTIRKGMLAAAPVIVTPPQSQSVYAGGNVTFSVSAGAAPPPTYQWYFNNAALNGQTGSTLTLSSVQAANAGSYTVTVTNSLGSVTSAAATLTVSPQPTPAPSASGGGGAISPGFLIGLLLLTGWRWRGHMTRRLGGPA